MEASECFSYVRQANAAYESGDFEEASRLYRLASGCFQNYLERFREYEWPSPELIDESKTRDLRSQISVDPDAAVAVSQGLEMGFKSAGIKFDDKTTFGAILFVIEQPEYVTQVISADKKGKMSFSYLTNPQTMQFVGERLQQDRIINIRK